LKSGVHAARGAQECEQTEHFAKDIDIHCWSIRQQDRDSPVYHSWSEGSFEKPHSQKDIRSELELDY
jgi:hypothetical protein